MLSYFVIDLSLLCLGYYRSAAVHVSNRDHVGGTPTHNPVLLKHSPLPLGCFLSFPLS